ncbi:ABC transporter permease [Streptomyces boluensis]|uniref:Transport permease protein n=1 Tax=Streptomyces boluensis TaxID=1775135 RepID=A0A964UT08_9ACTN|nr:ABC transporter permease [Streptomyces boluensis]NBE54776.1 ABC transporter permease [Streptomyces boluensis]
MTTATATLDATPALKTGEADGRIGLRANLRHTGALIRRNLLWIKANPESMFDALLMPIVFTLLFVYVFGGSIGQSLGGGQDAYVQYVIPGMLAMMSMTIAQAVGTGFNEDFQKGIMDRFRSLPIGRASVLIAKISVELLRMLIATTVLMIVAVLVGFDIVSWSGLFAAVGLSALFGFGVMWIFLTLGVTMKSAQSVQAMGFLVMMPLQFGSSIFAPTASMPGWLEAFTKYNPMSGLADAARGLMVGGPIAHGLWVTLAWSIGLTVVMAPIAVRKYTNKN